jgi:hypothetical protein
MAAVDVPVGQFFGSSLPHRNDSDLEVQVHAGQGVVAVYGYFFIIHGGNGKYMRAF